VDFELDEDERELADGMRRLCAGRFPLEEVRARADGDAVIDRARWQELAEAGVFGLCLAESAGGVGLGLTEAAVVFEELGHALVPGPIVATHLAAGLVDGATQGTTVVGIVEQTTRPGTGAVDPVPLIVELCEELDVLLVLSEDGVGALDPSALEAVRLARPMDPLTPVWSVSGPVAPTPVAGPELADWWRRDGAVLVAAQQVGAAAWATELAVEYAKERYQFGRPIGSFQAVKHLCADMAVRTEVARCAVHAAAVTVDDPEVGDVAAAVAGAKLLADEAAVANCRSCIQVHGGMGFTWEVPVHLAYKRARVLATQFGTSDVLSEALASSLAGALEK
jgi:alkylation response protein AidB-like acyl-CoA dehydrogenase